MSYLLPVQIVRLIFTLIYDKANISSGSHMHTELLLTICYFNDFTAQKNEVQL